MTDTNKIKAEELDNVAGGTTTEDWKEDFEKEFKKQLDIAAQNDQNNTNNSNFI